MECWHLHIAIICVSRLLSVSWRWPFPDSGKPTFLTSIYCLQATTSCTGCKDLSCLWLFPVTMWHQVKLISSVVKRIFQQMKIKVHPHIFPLIWVFLQMLMRIYCRADDLLFVFLFFLFFYSWFLSSQASFLVFEGFLLSCVWLLMSFFWLPSHVSPVSRYLPHPDVTNYLCPPCLFKPTFSFLFFVRWLCIWRAHASVYPLLFSPLKFPS